MELKVHSSPSQFSLALFSSSLSTRLLVYKKQRTRRRTVFVVPFLPSPATTEDIFLVGEVKKKGKTFFFGLLLFFFFPVAQLQKGNQALVTDSFSHSPSLSSCVGASLLSMRRLLYFVVALSLAGALPGVQVRDARRKVLVLGKN
jgi:hypothetical protein